MRGSLALFAVVGAKVLEATVHLSQGYPSTVDELLQRRALEETSLANRVFYYLVNFSLGTPPQELEAVLDTGSSDLWVMQSSAQMCVDLPEKCSKHSFNPDLSESFDNQSADPFVIHYGDNSYATGVFASDVLNLGGASLQSATFALAQESNSTEIVLGIGLPSLESAVKGVDDSTGTELGSYANVPQLLKQQGYIDTCAYSLWLNDINNSQGSILFGGVDFAKIDGELQRVPLINLSKRLSHPYSFHIMLSKVSTEDHVIAELQWPVLLDSGTSFAYLPPVLVQALASTLGYQLDESTGYHLGPCSVAADPSKVFVFNFSGKDITIPYSSLVLPWSEADPSTCAMLVLPSTGEYGTILGDVFLRNVYAVFDLENYEVGLAQAKFNVTDRDITTLVGEIPGERASFYNSTTINSNITVFNRWSGLDTAKKDVSDKSQKNHNKASLLSIPIFTTVLAAIAYVF